MDPKVSIIIPMYNVKDYIEQCLKSLTAQDFTEFEAICVDDGSTDSTLAVAHKAVGHDARFIFIEQQNAGQSAARNRAIEQAQGEFLLFLDADDYYLPETLESLYDIADAGELDYLDFSARSFYEDEDLRQVMVEEYDERPEVPGVHTGLELFAAYQKAERYHCSPCLHFFKRELLIQSGLRFEEGHIHEDELFSPVLMAQAKRAAFVDLPFYQRRIRANSSMTGSIGIHDVDGTFRSLWGLRAWLLEHLAELEPRIADAYSQRIYELAELMIRFVNGVGEDEIARYADSLPPEQRMVFNECICLARSLTRQLEEVYGSNAFKVGHALMKGPGWVKRKLGR